jgi:chromosome segregation ATPase
MVMKTHIVIATMAAALAIAGVSGASFAAQGDQVERHHHMSAEDRAALVDARIAALKAGLKLTPDQEKNWAPLEAAIREESKQLAERFAAWREEHKDHEAHHDLLERLQQRSERLTARAADLQKLIGAAKPLYDSLDEGQKHRFAVLLSASAGGHRQHWRREG